MKLKELVEKYGEQEVLCWAERADESLEWVNIKLEPPKQKTVWDLEVNDGFFVLTSDGKILYYKFGRYNNREIECGSAFLTYTEAEQSLERRKVEALLLKYGGRRWYKSDIWTDKNFNWTIWYNDVSEELKVCHGAPAQGAIYFSTIEQAEKAISEIGEERIKKALFEVR